MLIRPVTLLILAMFAIGCHPPRGEGGCTPQAWRCSTAGQPETCGSSSTWVPVGDDPCPVIGAQCCPTTSYGMSVMACLPHCPIVDAGIAEGGVQ